MRTRRMTFHAPDGAGGGAAGGQEGAAGGGAGGAAGGQGAGTGGAAGAGTEEELKLSKAQLDERLERAKRSREKELRAALGLDDGAKLEDVKALLAADKQRQEQAKTEAQKQAEALAKLQAEHQAAAAKLAAREMADLLRRSSARAGSPLLDDDDVLGIAGRELGRFREREHLGDREELSPKQMEKFVADLKSAKPFLFSGGAAAQPPSTGGEGGAGGSRAGAGSGAGAGAGAGKVDALKMSPDEFRAHLRRYGQSRR